jgi:hypothetical protein
MWPRDLSLGTRSFATRPERTKECERQAAVRFATDRQKTIAIIHFSEGRDRVGYKSALYETPIIFRPFRTGLGGTGSQG